MHCDHFGKKKNKPQREEAPGLLSSPTTPNPIVGE
jgi:hypothetical protein